MKYANHQQAGIVLADLLKEYVPKKYNCLGITTWRCSRRL